MVRNWLKILEVWFKDSMWALKDKLRMDVFRVCVCVFSLWHSLESTSPANETQRIYFRQLLDGLQVLQLSGCVCVRARPYRVCVPPVADRFATPLVCTLPRRASDSVCTLKEGGSTHGPLCV